MRSALGGLLLKGAAVAWVVLSLAVPVNVGSLIWLPAGVLAYLGYRLGSTTVLTQGLMPKSVLFLRGFADDNASHLGPRDMATIWLGAVPHPTGYAHPLTVLLHVNPIRLVRLLFSRPRDTTEEMLARYFTKYSPCVAVGRPGEVLVTAGAPRAFIVDGVWQEEVVRAIQTASAVVLSPGASPGLLWEVEQVLAYAPRHRILLTAEAFAGRPTAWDAVLEAWRVRFGAALPRSVPFLENPAFLYFDDQGEVQIQEVHWHSAFWWPWGWTADLSRTLDGLWDRITTGAPRKVAVEARPVLGRWVEGLLGVLTAYVVTLAVLVMAVMVGTALAWWLVPNDPIPPWRAPPFPYSDRAPSPLP